MHRFIAKTSISALTMCSVLALASDVFAQGRRFQPPVISPAVSEEGTVTFRVRALRSRERSRNRFGYAPDWAGTRDD